MHCQASSFLFHQQASLSSHLSLPPAQASVLYLSGLIPLSRDVASYKREAWFSMQLLSARVRFFSLPFFFWCWRNTPSTCVCCRIRRFCHSALISCGAKLLCVETIFFQLETKLRGSAIQSCCSHLFLLCSLFMLEYVDKESGKYFHDPSDCSSFWLLQKPPDKNLRKW